MSYCRFSSSCSNGMNSNIYCYYSTEDQYVTHVASTQIVNIQEAPVIGWNTYVYADLLHKQYRLRNEWMEHKAVREPIGLPYDGQSFYCDTKEECVATLEMLVDAGYNLPEYVIESILEEEE